MNSWFVMSPVKIILKGLLILCPMVFYGQTPIDKTGEIKLQIEQLLKEEKVEEVNTIIKENSFLEVSYVLQVLTQNIALAKKKEEKKTLANTYLVLGNFWHMQDNKIKAYDNYLRSERISKKIKDYNILGVTLMNRSGLLEDKQSRLSMVKEAIKAFEKTNDTGNLLKAHLNTGIAYSKFVDAKQIYASLSESEKNEIAFYKRHAFKHYHIADSLNASLNSDDFSGAISIYYAEWYRFEENYEKAMSFFKKGKNLFTNSGNIKGRVYATIEIAIIENKIGNTKKAIDLLQIAEKEAKKYQFKDYLEDIYTEFVAIYTSQNNPAKALAYQQNLTDIKVEVTKLSSQDQLRILNLESELRENQYQLEKYEAEERLNKLLTGISVFVILLMAVLAYFVIKSKKRKIESIEKNNVITKLEKTTIEAKLKSKQLEEELLKEKVRFSQEHLIQFANQVNKIENFLALLKTKIRNLNNDKNKQQTLNTLKLSFSELLNGQNHLKQLNSYTSQLNQDFFFYISKNYPNVSKNDQQLLAYIILNMNSKEISRILNITTDSVFKKRYRLRKKLKLGNDNSFQDFYNNIIAHVGKI